MIHILVLTTNNNEKNAYVKRIQSALNTLCSVTPGLTSNIRVKDIVIQVTYVNPKTGNAVGAFHIQPDYYIDNSGECSSMLNDLWMFIYSGHGSYSSMSRPLQLGSNYVYSYNYNQLPPITFAFACLTEASPITSSMGSVWIKTLDAGGVLYYGSSDTSWTDTNE